MPAPTKSLSRVTTMLLITLKFVMSNGWPQGLSCRTSHLSVRPLPANPSLRRRRASGIARAISHGQELQEGVPTHSGQKLGTLAGGGGKLLRLGRLLANRGVGSRTEVEKLILKGRVKVEGSIVRSPKARFPESSVLEVDGEECRAVPLLIAFHKPKGVITSIRDDWGREDLTSVLPQAVLRKHHPVGRLDGDTSGLLLLSSNGHLTHMLLQPRYEVEREYVARVAVPAGSGAPGSALGKALEEGVEAADGIHVAKLLGCEGEGGRDLRLVVREGKHRMVRRMLANAGYPVLELRRERYGKVLLGGLEEGAHQVVEGEQLVWAEELLSMLGS